MRDERDDELIARLREADRSLDEEQLPPSGVLRIANRISRELEEPERDRRLRWRPMFAFVAGAALVLAFFAWSRGSTPETPVVAAAPETPPAIVTGPDCHREEGDTLRLTGACKVVTQSPSMRVQTIETARMTLDDRVVSLDEGTALFDVDPVEGEPVRVVTPGGEVVVVGTRFQVTVDGESSRVDLYEGTLELRDRTGVVSRIYSGERHVMRHRAAAPARVAPTVAAAPPSNDEAGLTQEEIEAFDEEGVNDPPPAELEAEETEPARRDPPKAAEIRPNAGALIEEVRSLRRQGKYRQAARTLEAALKKKWPKRTADVLSYELGSIRARHLSDRGRACRHWERHLGRFVETRYRRQVVASMKFLGC